MIHTLRTKLYDFRFETAGLTTCITIVQRKTGIVRLIERCTRAQAQREWMFLLNRGAVLVENT